MANCSSHKQNPKGFDFTVGRLVWVRRQNGSWWPGQIMDPDGSFLDAGKSSGVPIKLLGRDDVNVDWYNLEETAQLKRVKAFRCGDHNSCIQKAKASQANPSKKRCKHGPREKAIILALELEAALMSKDSDDNSCEADKYDSESHQSWSNASPSKSNPSRDIHLSRNTSSSMEDSDSTPELQHPEKLKWQRTPINSENDGSKGYKKRMRGLDDLCVGSIPRDPSSLGDLGPLDCLPIKHMMNGSGSVCMTYFKKKSKAVFEEISKTKDGFDMLTKVLQSETLVSVPIIYDEFPSPIKSSPTICCNAVNNKNDPLKFASDLSGVPELLGYESSDNLFDVLLISEEELPDGFLPHVACSSSKPQISALGANLCQSSPAAAGSWINEAREESGFAAAATARISDVAQETENNPLVWRSKGKRTLRRQSRNPKLDCKNGLKADQLHRFKFPKLSIWHTSSESVLYDVQIKMKARNRPQDAADTSLTSKLNRKPVSGYSVVVEVLGDGESDFLYESDESTEKRTRSVKSINHNLSTKKTRMVSSLVRKPSAVGCIPVKLVFRRIDEALNGSTKAVNRV